MPVHTQSLNDNWALTCTTPKTDNAKGRPPLPSSIAAAIPSNVHLDLMAAGLVADPYIDLNEVRQDWVGWQDWSYELNFNHSASETTRSDLVFEGLDTIAEIILNGTPLGNTANMHRSYRFDVATALQDGANKLIVNFRSPRKVGLELDKQYAHRPNNYQDSM